MTRLRATALALVGAVALAGCGIRGLTELEEVPRGQLPSELRSPVTTTAPSMETRVVVYLVEQGRLVRRTQRADGEGPAPALRSLLAVDEPRGEQRSAIPAGTQLRAARVSGDRIHVDLSDTFLAVRGRDQVLAVAQLVWTATERAPSWEVRLLVNGAAIDVPVDDGALVSRPVRRRDYRTVQPR